LDEGDLVGAALLRYRVLAWTTGVFLLLLTLNMILKYVLDRPGLGDWVSMTHGFFYFVYVVITLDLWLRTRLDVGRTVLVVLAGTIPFASFFAERWVTHQVQPRLGPAAPAADGSAAARQ
jgi:integral membrane protein